MVPVLILNSVDYMLIMISLKSFLKYVNILFINRSVDSLVNLLPAYMYMRITAKKA